MTNLQTIQEQITELKTVISDALRFSYDNYIFLLSSELLIELTDAVDSQNTSIVISDCDQTNVEIFDIGRFLEQATTQYNQVEDQFSPQWEVLKTDIRQVG